MEVGLQMVKTIRISEIVKTVDNLHQKRQRMLARKQEILAQYSMEAMI